MKSFILLVLFLITAAIAFGYFIPTDYVIHKSINITSSPSYIHEHVGDLNKWELWTPWKEEDPTIQITTSEKTTGIGASQSWQDERGGGSLVITAWSTDKGIEYDLYFKGGKYKSKSAIKYQSISATKVKVSWAMHGKINKPIIGGYIAYYMKYTIGPKFQKGLQNLKKLVEQDK